MVLHIYKRRDRNGKNILFYTSDGELTPSRIAQRIRGGEIVYVGNTNTEVHTVDDDPDYVRSDPNNTGRDNLDSLPLF